MDVGAILNAVGIIDSGSPFVLLQSSLVNDAERESLLESIYLIERMCLMLHVHCCIIIFL